jgi:sec-independent protein translocase protein TatB
VRIVFGLGFGEIFLIAVIGIVVVGPRNLPTLMRTAGKWVSKLKRMSVDLRSQSGIDDIIRDENLERDIQELRSLSRMNIVDTLVKPAMAATAATPRPAPKADDGTRPALPAASKPTVSLPGREPVREREYPVIGCDAYGALPDDVAPYVSPYALPSEPNEPKIAPPKTEEPASAAASESEPTAAEAPSA